MGVLLKFSVEIAWPAGGCGLRFRGLRNINSPRLGETLNSSHFGGLGAARFSAQARMAGIPAVRDGLTMKRNIELMKVVKGHPLANWYTGLIPWAVLGLGIALIFFGSSVWPLSRRFRYRQKAARNRPSAIPTHHGGNRRYGL